MENTKIVENLKKYIPENDILINEPMSKHTSIKIGGPADVYVKLKSIKNISEILKFAKENNVPVTIVGNGSNNYRCTSYSIKCYR